MISYLAVQIAAQLEYRYVHCVVLKPGETPNHELNGESIKPSEFKWQILVDDSPTDEKVIQSVVSDIMHRISVLCRTKIGGCLASVTLRNLEISALTDDRNSLLVTAELSVTAI